MNYNGNSARLKKTKTMKKIFAAIIIASALALTACGNEATESTAVDTVAVDSTAIDSTAELFPAADTTVSK